MVSESLGVQEKVAEVEVLQCFSEKAYRLKKYLSMIAQNLIRLSFYVAHCHLMACKQN